MTVMVSAPRLIIIGLLSLMCNAFCQEQGADKEQLIRALYCEVLSANQPVEAQSKQEREMASKKQVAFSFIYWVNAYKDSSMHSKMKSVEKHIQIHLWELGDNLNARTEDPLDILGEAWGRWPESSDELRRRSEFGYKGCISHQSSIFDSVDRYKKAGAEFLLWYHNLHQEK